MDVEDIHSTPKTVRAVIAAPRASATPIVAPRMQSATSPPSQSSAAAGPHVTNIRIFEHSSDFTPYDW